MKKRHFRKDALEHIYQRSVDCGTIFYSRIDRLVFYTIASIQASKYRVKVVQLTIMFNHIHWLLEADTLSAQSNFIGQVTSVFTLSYNRSCNRHGPLFGRPYGSAPKLRLKDKMTAVNYLGNNPVVKRLVDHGAEDRWTFISYADGNKNPFSDKLRLSSASRKMRRAVDMVKACHKSGCHLEYQTLWKLFSDLSSMESEQLTDFIIHEYSFLRHEYILKLFGGMDKLLVAMDSNSGSEYDLAENDGSDNHAAYVEMIRVAGKLGWRKKMRAFTDVSERDFAMLVTTLFKSTSANQVQVARFLHLDIEEVRRILRNTRKR
ncbi:MAG: transposase [Bacteroidales bacterium]|nr:transposase [Candidatus Cryptobacteroides caccocaballi]